YAQVDYDACQEEAGFVPSAALRLPGTGAPPLGCFPLFPAGFGNRSAAERTNHPLLFNPFRPGGDDRCFAPSELEALLRPGDTGSQALVSELLRLCPANFRDPRIRRLVTTHSYDVDRPGVSPWLFDRDTSAYRPPLGHPDRPPTGPAIPF